MNNSKTDPKFDPTGFNKKFDAYEASKAVVESNYDDNGTFTGPHKENVESIITNVRNLFFIVLEMIIDKKNPIPFLFATESRKFYLSVFLLIFGTLLLLLASLMKSPE
jgi:hypothetical protein